MISVLVDAALGTPCKPGDLLRKGQSVGKTPGNSETAMTAPCPGIVRSIVFQDENHVLEIFIEPMDNSIE